MKEVKTIEGFREKYKKLMLCPQQKPHDIQQALLFLNENLFKTDCSVHSMKKNCKITAQNFSSRFKNYTGFTPREYIVFHRIELAKYLLQKQRLQKIPVNSIGFYVGYEKPSAFCTRFKKKTGISPNQWRYRKKSEEKKE